MKHFFLLNINFHMMQIFLVIVTNSYIKNSTQYFEISSLHEYKFNKNKNDCSNRYVDCGRHYIQCNPRNRLQLGNPASFVIFLVPVIRVAPDTDLTGYPAA